eukprot:9487573-Pyramimonas_sp.AAC.1
MTNAPGHNDRSPKQLEPRRRLELLGRIVEVAAGDARHVAQALRQLQQVLHLADVLTREAKGCREICRGSRYLCCHLTMEMS